MPPKDPSKPLTPTQQAIKRLKDKVPAAKVAIDEYDARRALEASQVGADKIKVNQSPKPVLRAQPHPNARGSSMRTPVDAIEIVPDGEELVPDKKNGGWIMKKFADESSNDENGA